MPHASISIKQSRSDQDDLRRQGEHASALPDLLQTVGLDFGQQAIIRRDAATFALYTLTDAVSESTGNTVRMGRTGRGRLDAAEREQFRGTLDSAAIDPAATEQEARDGQKLLELLDDDGHPRDLVVIAPHGGEIEPAPMTRPNTSRICWSTLA